MSNDLSSNPVKSRKVSKGKESLRSYHMLAKCADRRVLSLFPSICYWEDFNHERQDEIMQVLSCVYYLGVSGTVSAPDLLKQLQTSRPELTSSLKWLNNNGLVSSEKLGRTSSYWLTGRGVLILMAFKDFQVFDKVKPLLRNARFKGDRLCFALLTLGYCQPKCSSAIYDLLCNYSEKGNTIGSLSSDAACESLLSFYEAQSKLSTSVLPNYLGVFKEFTTSGFQQVLGVLLVSMKPAVEDYNWLVEFFGEVIEYYYNPTRQAYVNLLSESADLHTRLELYKKAQDRQIRAEAASMEVTFNVPAANVAKFMSMPAHLRAVATRLMLEPLSFINKELNWYFWTT